MKNLAVCIFAFALGVSAAAHAAPAPKQECQLTVDADKIDGEVLKGKDGTATGNVVITQCAMKIHADSVNMTTRNNQPDRIVATGRVVLISEKSGVATGDNGVYEVAKNLVTMTGHVVLKDGKNVLTGNHLTYNLTTGVAQVDPGAAGGRVHAVLSQPADPAPK
jgi:lipopolysaccharide export system protein LptA